MFDCFAQSAPLVFQPLTAVYPRREPCNCEVNPQSQSAFFSVLPAEIRNEIYEYVLAFPSPECDAFPDLTPHPLSLLLTSHRTHQEASLLAFQFFTFRLTGRDMKVYVNMQRRIAHLSDQQVNSITSIATVFGIPGSSFPVPTFENAMTLLPNLKRFELRMIKDKQFFHSAHHSAPARVDAHLGVQKYAPSWFANNIIESFLASYAFKRKGTKENWKPYWPQVEDHGYFHLLHDVDDNGSPCITPFISPEAVGKVRGVEICPCGCDAIIWTTADLIQDTGRAVAIEVVFHGKPLVHMDLDLDTRLNKSCHGNAILLKPGAPSLDLAESPGSSEGGPSGLEYAPNEEYWEELKRRNGVLPAKFRHYWKSMWKMVAKQPQAVDPHPGSYHHGTGDWTRIREIEAEMAPAVQSASDAHVQNEGHREDASADVVQGGDNKDNSSTEHAQWLAPRMGDVPTPWRADLSRDLDDLSTVAAAISRNLDDRCGVGDM